MNRGAKYSVGIVLAALAIVVPQILLAQGEITLEELAEQVRILFASREETNSRISALETRTAPTPAPTFTAQPTRTPRPTATRTPPPNPSKFRVPAQQIVDDYKEDRRNAQEKYQEVVFEIEGEVYLTEKSAGFITAVQFKIKGGIFDAVKCGLADTERVRVEDLPRGSYIILRGTGQRKGMGLIYIRECEIVDPSSPAPRPEPTPKVWPSPTFTPTPTLSPATATRDWQAVLDETAAYQWVNQAMDNLWEQKNVHFSRGGWMQWYSEQNLVEVFLYIVDRCDLTGDELVALIWEYERDPVIAAMNRKYEPNLTTEIAIFRDLNRAAGFDTRPCTHLIDRLKGLYEKETSG